MAVRIRLKRLGRKKRPFFRIVAIDSKTRREGAEIERLGWYDPVNANNNFSIKEEILIIASSNRMITSGCILNNLTLLRPYILSKNFFFILKPKICSLAF